jgi:hypothetical protein
MTYSQAPEVKGEDGVQTTRCPTLPIGEGSDAGDEHATYFVLPGAVEELERPPHTRRVATLGITAAHGDDIGTWTGKGKTDVRRIGVSHDSS